MRGAIEAGAKERNFREFKAKRGWKGPKGYIEGKLGWQDMRASD